MFFKKEDSEAWRDETWATWPSLQLAIDQGSDGLSGSFALEHFFGCNIRRFCDYSHGAHKPLLQALNKLSRHLGGAPG